MRKKQMIWKTKGMNKDLSVSAFNPEFSFENYNLRLSTNEGNTLLSWVNEKGTSLVEISIDASIWGGDSEETAIKGEAIGTAILKDTLVIFTTGDEDGNDNIYKIDISGGVTLLFRGNLGFSRRIETLVSYEAEHIQKVYWTDGVNQPRVINIVADASQIQLWSDIVEDLEGGIFTRFDFVPAINNGKIEAEKNAGGSGVFAPGVIQYCFTYYNKYGQQSNIVDVTPLHYISPSDRGGRPDEKVSNSFTINITEVDSNFDYVRLYAIQRTSVDNVPFVRLLEDFKIHGDSSLVRTEVLNEYYSSAETSSYLYPKVKEVTVTGGSVTVTFSDSIANFGAESTVVVRDAINAPITHQEFSFWHLMRNRLPTQVGEALDNDAYFEEKYYCGFRLTYNLSQAVGRYLGSSTTTAVPWTIVIGSSVVTVDNHPISDVIEAVWYCVYNYLDQKWYICHTLPTISETPDIQSVTEDSFAYVDNGISGSAVDPAEMLFIGGKDTRIETLTDKDNTLFMGNVSTPNVNMKSLNDFFAGNWQEIKFKNDSTDIKILDLGDANGIYSYKHQLDKSLEDISTFKGGDTYRFGFQLQKKTGEWTEPVWIGDVRNEKYPVVNDNQVNLVFAESELKFDGLSDKSIFKVCKSIRPVIVYPNIADREVLCQGVLNPTVFNAADRIDNSPYAQASWYFRPIMKSGIDFVESDSLSEGGDCYGEANGTSGDPGTVITGSEDLSVSAGYEGQTVPVYVLVADVVSEGDNNKVEEILKRGYFNLHKVTNTTGFGGNRNVIGGSRSNDAMWTATNQYWFSFIGAVVIGETTVTRTIAGDTNTYNCQRIAFIRRESKWGTAYEFGTKPLQEQTDGITVYEQGVYNPSTTDTQFDFYAGMHQDSLNRYFFKKSSNLDSDYVFKFYDTQRYYEITYSVDASGVQDEDDYTNDIVFTHTGSMVEYKHYKHLFSTADLVGDEITEAARQIEIQGSGCFDVDDTDYEETFGNFGGNRNNPRSTDTRARRGTSSNTQFFVDNSIVTLNSPDLEFDTDVQTYGKDGLSLRIAGIIPITSNISAHHITIKSNMLEHMHNLDKDTSLGGRKFGTGELGYNVCYVNNANNAGKRLVSDYLWNDVLVGSYPDGEDKDKIQTSQRFHDFLVYPWQRNGSLNNDFRKDDEASSLLKTKKESNLLFSKYTIYNSKVFDAGSSCNVALQIHLTENEEVMNYRLPGRTDSSNLDINYYPNIDKILYNENGYKSIFMAGNDSDITPADLTSSISMKYKSATHAVLSLMPSSGNTTIPILSNTTGDSTSRLFWKTSGGASFSALTAPSDTSGVSYLLLGELYKERREGEEESTKLFGGTSISALKANNWQIGGEAKPIEVTEDGNIITISPVSLQWTYGDTYYQRYDCLKTYAFTPEDTNQIVEILSFMCETHVNLDGRYDRNRGQIDNTNMKPQIFNLLNPVYSQQDNFFTYKQSGMDSNESTTYPNQVAFSMTKTSGADVDEWTHVTLASTVELDGDKGKLNKLTRLNDQIIALQDSGVSQILYNENTQITTTAGVPIEIANSGKVQGVRYLSDTIGCSNKWSVVNTPSGIYFADSHDKAIYLYNGQFTNISQKGGMESWCKINDIQTFDGMYDRKNQDVLYKDSNTVLAYSEKLGAFTSFYDYGSAFRLCNVGNKGIWLKNDEDDDVLTVSLWRHQEGDYCRFFGEDMPYWMTLVGNPEPQLDKTFTNLEFRACVEGEGTPILNTDNEIVGFIPSPPFDYLETWNEHQHGIAYLDTNDGHLGMTHHRSDNNGYLKRKFRIWRSDIPRNNAVLDNERPIPDTLTYSTDDNLGISRYFKKPLDRMRNPWLYLKLKKEASEVLNGDGDVVPLPKTEIHDIMMSYFS